MILIRCFCGKIRKISGTDKPTLKFSNYIVFFFLENRVWHLSSNVRKCTIEHAKCNQHGIWSVWSEFTDPIWRISVRGISGRQQRCWADCPMCKLIGFFTECIHVYPQRYIFSCCGSLYSEMIWIKCQAVVWCGGGGGAGG